jgi:hypothetical protein
MPNTIRYPPDIPKHYTSHLDRYLGANGQMAPLFGRNRTKILRRLALRATDDKPRSLRTENVDYAEPLDLADPVLRSFPIGFEVISPPISLEPLAGASRNRKFADSLLEGAGFEPSRSRGHGGAPLSRLPARSRKQGSCDPYRLRFKRPGSLGVSRECILQRGRHIPEAAVTASSQASSSSN